MKKIVVLGSTGSIGRQTLDVVRAFPEDFDVVGLAAGNNQKMLLEQYQLATGLVSVRSFDIDANDLYLNRTSADEITDKVIAVSRQCLEQDGAEALISGCTLAGSVLSKVAREDPDVMPAPIIDGMVVGLKMAEMMVSLGQVGMPPVSRIGVYEQPPLEDLDKLRKSQDQPMPSWSSSIHTSSKSATQTVTTRSDSPTLPV